MIERAALGLTKPKVGETVLIKLPDGKERRVRIAGLAGLAPDRAGSAGV